MLTAPPKETWRTGFRPIVTEARRHPRIVVEAPVQLSLGGKEFVNVIVHDVSPDSVQVRCEEATGQLFNHHRALIGDGIVQLDVHVAVLSPHNAGALALPGSCTIVHETPCENGQVAFGLRFATGSRLGTRLLNAFINTSMAPTLS